MDEMRERIVARGDKRWRIALGFILIILVFAVPFALAQLTPLTENYRTCKAGIRTPLDSTALVSGLELPYIADSTYILRCDEGRYISFYSSADKQSLWVAYLLTAPDVDIDPVKRRDYFRPSPEVKRRVWYSAESSDYKGSSFDRGHLVPSRDRSASREENDATFYFSNISPQRPNINRNGWAFLENYVREVARRYGYVYVATGGVFNLLNQRYVGENMVTVPEAFFKVLLTRDGDEWLAVGFVVPNSEDADRNFFVYMTSVRDVEALTGIDFFANLPRDAQDSCETKRKMIKLN